MLFDYLLIIGVFTFPIFYRYVFWINFLQTNKKVFSKEGKTGIFHFWFLLEIFLLFFAGVIVLNQPFEIIFYPMFFYFGILQTIFVLGQMFRKKISFPKMNIIIFTVSSGLLFLIIINFIFLYKIFGGTAWYYYILGNLILSPFISLGLYKVSLLILKPKNMKKIAILSGGPGLEKEIAKKSAFFFQSYIQKEYDYYELPEQLDRFLENRKLYSLVIPVFHGEYGEDGKIFALLDILNIPHTFSNYDIHAICLDKYKTNVLLNELDIKIPKQFLAKDPINTLGNYPVIMKPNKGGSSFHTYKIDTQEEFIDKFTLLEKELSDDILVQQFICGDEYSVPVVDGEILPIMKLEKQSPDDYFDYESKYESEIRIKETFPKISENIETQLKENTQKIYNYFNIKGFARIDFLVQGTEVYFLEINTIPGMTEVSILPKSWKLTRRTFEELVTKIIK